jgi:hypothetical protein
VAIHPYHPLRPHDLACSSVGPGHQVHWIHAKKSVVEPQPVIEVSIAIHPDGRVDLEGDGLSLALWNHYPERLAAAFDYWGRAVWKPRYHVLSLPGLHGSIFNMVKLQDRSRCEQLHGMAH